MLAAGTTATHTATRPYARSGKAGRIVQLAAIIGATCWATYALSASETALSVRTGHLVAVAIVLAALVPLGLLRRRSLNAASPATMTVLVVAEIAAMAAIGSMGSVVVEVDPSAVIAPLGAVSWGVCVWLIHAGR